MKDTIILTNITEYYVTDTMTENLLYKANEYGIGEFLTGASSIPPIRQKAKKFGISLSVSIAYPSGAYFADAKAEEIAELVERYPEIGAFYVVISLGMFIGRGPEWLQDELKAIRVASAGRKLFVVTEIASLLKNGKAEEFVQICCDNGVDGVVVSTGFTPYKANFPSEADIRAFSKIANGKLTLVGTGIDQKTALNAGCQRVFAGIDVELLIKS